MFSLRQISSLVWKLFPLGSKGEIFFRTLYHAINSNAIISRYQFNKAERSYQKWKIIHRKRIEIDLPTPDNIPSVTFILRILPGNEEYGIRTIQSIKDQSLGYWRILICCSQEHDTELLFEVILQDSRIRILEKIHNNFDQVLSKMDTDYLVFCDSGDVFSKYFIKVFGLQIF